VITDIFQIEADKMGEMKQIAEESSTQVRQEGSTYERADFTEP